MSTKITKVIKEEEMNELARLEFSLKAAETIMSTVQNSQPVNTELFTQCSKQYSDIYTEYNILFNKLAYKYFNEEMFLHPLHNMLFDINNLLFIMVV